MAFLSGARNSEPIVKYVSHKVSVLRWKPQVAGAIGSSEVFASGSWNDDEDNQVCLWQYRGGTDEGDVEPRLVCESRVDPDVTDLQFLDEQRLMSSFSNGCVVMYRLQAAREALSRVHTWEVLHHLPHGQPAPCTCLAVCGGDSLISGGEDGRINVISVDGQQVIRKIDNADNATVTALACTLLSEVLSTSSSGQLKLWDLKRAGSKPVRTIVMSGECLSIQSMDRHPHQPHLVALGRGDGSLCFWDLRQEKQPVQVIQAHSSDVWGVQFHPSYPNHLFTCSHEGSLWHWDATNQSSSQPSRVSRLMASSQSFSPSVASSRRSNGTPAAIHSTPLSKQTTSTHHSSPLHTEPTSSSSSSPWLSGAVHQGKVEIINFLPDNSLSVNCLDIESQNLICGSDNESLYVVPNLRLR